MKKLFQYAFAAVIAVGAFTSCSDDDDPVIPGQNIENKSYTAADGLNLVVNGEPLVGKTVTFTKGTDDNAKIKLAGESFDLSTILGSIGTKAEVEEPGMKVPTCGVIPGSPEYEFDVKLVGTGDECTFEGSEEAEYCTFKYSGKVTKDALNFNITDLKLKNTSLAGTSWSPYSYATGSSTMYQTIYIGWESEKTIPMFGFWEMQPSTVFTLAMQLTQVDVNGTKMSITQALATVLKEVTFEEDGNIRAKYVDAVNESSEIEESPVNICQYVIDGDGKLLLFLNPSSIMAAMAEKAKNTRSVDYMTAISKAMNFLIPFVRNGFPLVYGEYNGSDVDFPDDPKAIYFALPTNFMLQILDIMKPIVEDADFQKEIIELASKDPTMGSMAGSLGDIFGALPEVIEKTSKCEVGLFMKQN